MDQPQATQPPENPPAASAEAADERVQRAALEVLDLGQGLSRELERLRQAQARAAGLRPPTWALLSLVAEAGELGVTVSDAAVHLSVRPQALSGAVGELVDEGLMEREVDPTDGRARRLRVTPAGLARLAPGEELRLRLLREIVAQIPQPTVAKLVLSRLQMALKHCLSDNSKA
ncbi:MAG: MarR family transcriptional regulator [Pseudomonadota bacterium]